MDDIRMFGDDGETVAFNKLARRMLDLWRLLLPWVPQDYTGYKPHEYEGMKDEDRIVSLFEMLEGSAFGDMIFGSLADDDGWCDLEKRWDDE